MRFVEVEVTRSDLIDYLVSVIGEMSRPHPVRVGLDGVDAAGKTILSDELADVLEQRGHAVVRASIDGFHNPRSIRVQRGPDSPVGYFEDSFDHASLLEELLVPLGPGGTRVFRRRVFDHRSDSAVLSPEERCPAQAILLFDGVFLHRPELRGHWDVSIFVHADFQVTLGRARRRDVELLGSAELVEEAYRQRYIPGQELYLSACDPKARADIVIDNNDPAEPILIRKAASAGSGRASTVNPD